MLVPCRPSIFDLETFSTTDLIVAVLNAVMTRGKKRQQTEQALKETNVAVCPELFGERVAFDHANTVGFSAQEYEPAGKAAAYFPVPVQKQLKLLTVENDTIVQNLPAKAE